MGDLFVWLGDAGALGVGGVSSVVHGGCSRVVVERPDDAAVVVDGPRAVRVDGQRQLIDGTSSVAVVEEEQRLVPGVAPMRFGRDPQPGTRCAHCGIARLPHWLDGEVIGGLRMIS